MPDFKKTYFVDEFTNFSIMEAKGQRGDIAVDGSFGAVIVAAGNSTRMGGKRTKVLELLNGKPVLAYSLRAFEACPEVGEIVVVCREEDRPELEPLLKSVTKPVCLVNGGAQRQDSVLAGVKALRGRDYVLIHDGARPMATPELIQRVCADVLREGAAAAAVNVKDTCKVGDESGFVQSTPSRETLFAVQTPQGFELDLYLYAAEKASQTGKSYTDDCQLVEATGGRVYLSQGDYRNIKITTPEDLLSARAFMRGERTMRIGNGYDVHRLVENRRLILGGVHIPFEKGLLGHSDADVLCHAISDALLGAAALGDIGKLFPDNNPAYAGANSLLLLSQVCEKLAEHGFSICNIDATIMAQRPKLAPYREEMRKNIATACGISLERVSVKATTEEGLGFTGEGLGISSSAVCLLE